MTDPADTPARERLMEGIDRAARELVVHSCSGGEQTATAFGTIIRAEMGIEPR